MGFKVGGFGGGAGKTTMPPPDVSGKGRQDIGPNGPRTNTNANSTNGTNNGTNTTNGPNSNGQSVDGKNGKGGKLGGNLLDFGMNAGSGALSLLGPGALGGAGTAGGAAGGQNLTAQPAGGQNGGLLSSAGKGGGIAQMFQQLLMLIGLQQMLKGGESGQSPLQQATTQSGGGQAAQGGQGGVNGMIQQLQQMMQQMMQMMQQLTGMQQGGGNSAGAQSGGQSAGGQSAGQAGGGNMLSNVLSSALQMTGLNALMSLLGGGSNNGVK